MSLNPSPGGDTPGLSLVGTAGTRAAAMALRTEVEMHYPGTLVEWLELDAANAAGLSPSGSVVAFLFGADAEPALNTWLARWVSLKALTPLLPIATAGKDIPPPPCDGLKSRNWSVAGHRQIILNRIGALLGLVVQRGGTEVFISYRAADGKEPATRIHEHLSGLGYRTFLDEADDTLSGNPNLPLGEEVQREIATRLARAQAVLLIDTPRASESRWVHLEVEMAIGRMVPILPAVFAKVQSTPRCRFLQLLSLQRQIPLPIMMDGVIPELTDHDLSSITEELESYLSDIYRRRVLGARSVARQFTGQRWTFEPCDLKPHLYEAHKARATDSLSLLTCCSYEDAVFPGTLSQFAQDLSGLAQTHCHYWQHLYFYAGEVLFEENLKRIFDRELRDYRKANIRLLNYEEAVVYITRLTEAFNAIP